MSEILFSENAPRVRKDFSKIPRILEIPNLIEIQKESFERFLQTRIEPEKRENVGLQAVFNSVFPIKDFNDTASLEFVGYTLEEPKYDVQECLQRGMTYAAPFKVTIRLVAWDDSEGSQTIRDVKEQEVYFGEIPIMTDNGTFIINGTERVIVSQLHRSPGIFFDTTTSSTVSAAGKKIYSVPHHPLPRLLARPRVRPQGPALRPHRPAPEDPGHGAAEGPRLHRRGPAQLLLLARDGSASTASGS